MKQITWTALAIAVLLTWMQGVVVAQDDGLTMQVTLGYDGYCHGGDWCPVYVVLSNAGADVAGELRVSVGGESDVYARQVVLPSQSRKAFHFYLPYVDAFSSSHPTVEFIVGRDVLLSEQAVGIQLDENDRLYGVASSDPSALNFLNSVVPAGGSAAVAHLDLDSLPPDPLGWEGLGVLILNDVDTSVLSAEQRRAMGSWIAHGGHLIVSGGAGAARTIAGVSDLLPVTVGGTRSVESLWALGEQSGAAASAGPYAVTEAALRGGEVLIEQDDLILLARRIYGMGRVDFLAFDAGLNPFTRWDDNVRLWEEIIEAGAVNVRRLAVRNGYNAYDAINGIPGLELPSTLQILAFLLAYTLLIGPINYVVLRKLDKRELAWLTIPVLVVGFTVCAYMTGFQIRGGRAIVHRLGVVYVPEGTNVGRVSQAVGIFSPRRTNYDVRVADAEVRQILDEYYGGPDRQPLHIFKEAGGLTVADLRVDVGGIQPFVAEGYADVPGVEADLRLVEDEAGELWLQGTIRNGEMALKDAVLLAGDGEQRLDDLEAGEEVQVRLPLHGGGAAGSGEGAVAPTPIPAPYYFGEPGVPERILGPGDYWGDPTLRQRYQLLQAIFSLSGPYGPGLASGGSQAGLGASVHLVGWAEETCPLPVEVVDRPFSSVETALYIYALLVEGPDMSATVTVPPSLITRAVVESTGYVDVWDEGLHMEPESQVTFRFTVWPAVMVRRVDELALNMWSGSSGYAGGPPTVSLWNRETGDWQEMDVGWGQRSIPNAGAYVSPSGSVLLRLETDETGAAEIESLTITIKGQR